MMATYHGFSMFQPLQQQMDKVDFPIFNGQAHVMDFLVRIAKVEKTSKMEIQRINKWNL